MYVIYYKDSTVLASKKRYKSAGAAKAAITRMEKPMHPDECGRITWAEETVFHDIIEKVVTKTNMMSGKEYQERVNTPICCSPSSETYWSM